MRHYSFVAILGLSLLATLPLKAQPSASDVLQPFAFNHREGTDLGIDFSFLLDKPAGKDGFVTVKGSHFVTPKGDRIRFWGVNITDWTRNSVQIPDKKDAVLYAKALSRFGINVVRLTFLDFPATRGVIDRTRKDTRKLDSLQMDKLDYWISELKKNGVYTDLNLMVGRTYKEEDGVQEYQQVGWAKYSSYFDPTIIGLLKEFAQSLLTHYNPYTRNEYRNEPAVCIVELVNENTLFDGWANDRLHAVDNPGRDANFRYLTKYHDNLLTDLYQKWLQKNRSKTELDVLLKEAKLNPNERLPRLKKEEFATASPTRFQTECAFYLDLEKQFFLQMNGFLKNDLKIKNLLLGSNDFLHDQPMMPMVESNSVMDMIDGHVYWQSPTEPRPRNTPMVNDPYYSTLARLSRTALAGKPYVVTEVNNAFPGDYLSEGIPLLAAYGALHDWDAIMWYTFEPKTERATASYVGDAFDISLDPVKMPQIAAGAMMFLRGDVHAAKETILRNYTRAYMLETMRMPQSDMPFYHPGFPMQTLLEHSTRIASLNSKKASVHTSTTPFPMVSDTRELVWNLQPDKATGKYKNGLVTINTPKSQGIIGFTGASEVSVQNQPKNLSVKIKNSFAAITLSSLDNKPIVESSSLLLITGSRVENTGLRYDEKRSGSVSTGNAPSLIEAVVGTITLTNMPSGKVVTVSPLDGSGKPMGTPRQARRIDNGYVFEVGEPATTWYSISITHQ